MATLARALMVQGTASGGEMARAQIVQAGAAGVFPDVL
jgi:cobyric acid synthase